MNLFTMSLNCPVLACNNIIGNALTVARVSRQLSPRTVKVEQIETIFKFKRITLAVAVLGIGLRGDVYNPRTTTVRY